MPPKAKKSRSAGGDPTARATILEAAVALLRERRGAEITTDDVARRAACAKGLVHYHFKRKDQLLAAAAARLWEARTQEWRRALAHSDPKAAISAAWELLASESSSGSAGACATLGTRPEELVVQSVNAGRADFSRALAAALGQLLDRMQLEPGIPLGELGALLAAIVEGIGLQLGSAADRAELDQAWAAFWVGLLSLTRPRTT